SLYNEEIHVPLVIIDPRLTPSRRSVPTPVSLRDIPATVVELAAFPDASPFPGRSLARFWYSDSADDPSIADPVFFSGVEETIGHHRGSQAVLSDDMVYIRNPNGSDELYNIKDDPAERHDIATSQAAQPDLERLRASLREVISENPTASSTRSR